MTAPQLTTLKRTKASERAKELTTTKGASARVLPKIGKTPESLLLFDLNEALSVLQYETEISLDIETSGLSPWKDKIAVVSLYGEESHVSAVFHIRGNLPDKLRLFLSEPGRRYTGHNVAGFDALFLSVAGVDIFGPTWYDTLLGELCVIKSGRRDVRVNLQQSVKRRLGLDLDKTMDHRTWMQPTLTEEQLAYAVGDVRHLPRLRQEQFAAVAGTKQEEALLFEQSLMPTMMRMVLNGLPFSTSKFLDYTAGLANNRETQFENLVETFGPINFRSSMQVKKAFAEHGIQLSSTKHDELVEISTMGGRSGEIVDVLLDWKKSDQRLKMYSPEWLSKYVINERVHPRVWQCAADTGRMTNSDPNLQQVPKDTEALISARSMFEAPPGWKIVSADYSQIEIRVAAYYARDQTMLDVLRAEDMHRQVAALIFNIPVDQVTSAQRKLAKAAVFTLLFGGGAGRLYDYARHNGSVLTLDEAKSIVKQFFNRFRGLSDMRSKAFAMANAGRAINLDLPTGLRRTLVGESLKGTTVLNTLVQGTAAAGLKYGLFEAGKRGLDKYLGAVVHDENVACVPANECDDYYRELEECMILGMQRVIPGIEIKVGKQVNQSWAEEKAA